MIFFQLTRVSLKSKSVKEYEMSIMDEFHLFFNIHIKLSSPSAWKKKSAPLIFQFLPVTVTARNANVETDYFCNCVAPTFVVGITALVRTFHHLQNYTGLGE